MVVIIYNNNQIYFKHSNNIDYKKVDNLWITTRENYTDWVSKFKKYIQNNKKLNNKFKWKTFNTWWLNSLTMKDSEQNTSFKKHGFQIT